MQQLPHRVGPHEQTQLLATNPFLALKRQCNNNSNKGNSSACSKKLRRQTISDPYAHIKRHYADVDAVASATSNSSSSNSNNNNEAFAADSHGTTATSFTATAEVEQQINNNNSSNNNGPGFGQWCGRGNHQQQMLMPNELLLQASQLTAADCNHNHNLRYVPPLPTATPPIQPVAGAYDCLVVRRPMRLPLRKHHTFHFQTTETANGKLQQLRRQLQQQQLERAQGPLIFRPLALSERHAFKPISPTPATTATATAATAAAAADDAQQQQLQQPAIGQLNPAASLEALEVLTKTHPDFMFARTKPQNEQIAATPTTPTTATTTAAAADAAEEEDEDLGYSFCEEEYMVDDEENAHNNNDDHHVDDDDDDDDDEDEAAAKAAHNLTAPPTTPAHSAAVANATAGALKYFMTQSYREVHI